MHTRFEALTRAMLNDGWFTSSDGDVESPTGYFGYVTNTLPQLPEIYDVFSDTIEAYGKPEDSDMVGSFFVSINSAGVLNVRRCASNEVARTEYELAQASYATW